MSKVTTNQLKEILNKNWMTHDAMWFYHCLQECGIEKTNKINLAAIRAMAQIEVKRLTELLAVEKISDIEHCKIFFDGACEIIKADFMNFSYTFESPNRLQVEMKNCFAYEGIKRIGAIEQYECGIFERIDGWLDGLGIGFNVKPQVEGCMMHAEGVCNRDYRLDFSVRM
jgi:hypothetical protein